MRLFFLVVAIVNNIMYRVYGDYGVITLLLMLSVLLLQPGAIITPALLVSIL